MATEGLPPLDGAVVVFEALGDKTRLRLLLLLADGEANVGALRARIGLPQPTVSHHLGLLRLAGLVRDRRQGKNIYYSLAGPPPDHRGVRLARAGAVVTLSPAPVAPPRAH
jgi:DNA-binding transcriptional ArsR family regulator